MKAKYDSCHWDKNKQLGAYTSINERSKSRLPRMGKTVLPVPQPTSSILPHQESQRYERGHRFSSLAAYLLHTDQEGA
jgi:hypothetical protein